MAARGVVDLGGEAAAQRGGVVGEAGGRPELLHVDLRLEVRGTVVAVDGARARAGRGGGRAAGSRGRPGPGRGPSRMPPTAGVRAAASTGCYRWRRSGRGARRVAASPVPASWSACSAAARRASSRRRWSSASSGIERREPWARCAWRIATASLFGPGSAAQCGSSGSVGVRDRRRAGARRRDRAHPLPRRRRRRSRRRTASPGARRRRGSCAARPSSGVATSRTYAASSSAVIGRPRTIPFGLPTISHARW